MAMTMACPSRSALSLPPSPCPLAPAMPAPALTPLLFCLHPAGPCSMKGKSTRLCNSTRVELWQRFQRPLRDLQLWRALAQRLLDVTVSLPDLPSVHTFLPQIEVTLLWPGWPPHVAGRGCRPLSSGSAPLPGTAMLTSAQRSSSVLVQKAKHSVTPGLLSDLLPPRSVQGLCFRTPVSAILQGSISGCRPLPIWWLQVTKNLTRGCLEHGAVWADLQLDSVTWLFQV